MEALLTCRICKKTVNEPKTLPCFHSFCKKCLVTYIKDECEKTQTKRGAPHFLNCPTCRTQFESKHDDERNTPANSFIIKMLNLQQTRTFSCESCEAQVPVTCKCIQCERYLCESCLKTHDNWSDFEQHVVMTLEELAKPENHSKAKRKPDLCPKKAHGNIPLEFYCNTCQELACIKCVLLNHPNPGHINQPTEIVAEQRKKSLRTTSGILQKTYEKVETALQNINRATQNLQANTEKAKDMIRQQEEKILIELSQRVKEQTTILLDEVDERHNEANQKLLKQHGHIKAYHEKVHGSFDFANSIVENAGNENILLLSTEIHVNAKDIKKECPKKMDPINDGVIEYRAKSIRTVVDNINLNLDDLGIIGKFVPLVLRAVKWEYNSVIHE